MGEDSKNIGNIDLSALSKAVAEELKKLNSEDKDRTAPATPGSTDNKPTWNCPECGTPVKEGTKYCPGCGVELIWEE